MYHIGYAHDEKHSDANSADISISYRHSLKRVQREGEMARPSYFTPT
jgi:hypothetical protein